MNGTAAGGGYELALACDEILLVDDKASAVSLPEIPLLAVLPGTGGLTRVVEKRGVRRDLADAFSTRTEGVEVEWYWELRSYSRPGWIGTQDFRRLFPRGFEGFKDPAPWMKALSTALQGWLKEERIDERRLESCLALIAVRLHEHRQRVAPVTP